MTQKLHCGAIVLAGGRSSRFGRDKSLLKIDGTNITADNLQRWQGLFAQILIVSNSENKLAIPGTREICDIYRDCGPMAGLHAGLTASQQPYNFLTACDMPCLERQMIERLIATAQTTEAQVVAFRCSERVEPLCALYHKDCRDTAEALLQAGRRSMMALLDRCRTEYIQLENEIFNINTPADAADFAARRQEHKLSY